MRLTISMHLKARPAAPPKTLAKLKHDFIALSGWKVTINPSAADTPPLDILQAVITETLQGMAMTDPKPDDMNKMIADAIAWMGQLQYRAPQPLPGQVPPDQPTLIP